MQDFIKFLKTTIQQFFLKFAQYNLIFYHVYQTFCQIKNSITNLWPMERNFAIRVFNSEPVKCEKCGGQSPSFRILTSEKGNLYCYECTLVNSHIFRSIKSPYKEDFLDFLNQMPIPNFKEAEQCLKEIQSIKQLGDKIIKDIKEKIEMFQKQFNAFLLGAKTTCQKYIQKVKKYGQLTFQTWLKNPPQPLNQEKFLLNIKNKRKIITGLKQNLDQMQLNIPSLDEILKAKENECLKISFCKESIGSLISIKGNIYVGTTTGMIVYENGQQIKQFKAHQALIRVLAYDGQYMLFSGSDDYSIKAWDLHGDEMKLIATFGTIDGKKSYHRQFVLLQGNKLLATSRGQFDDYKIRLWELNDFTNVKELEGHDAYIKGMIAGCKDHEIISVSDDRSMKLWNTRTLKCTRNYYHGRKLNSVFMNVDCGVIALTDEDNRLILIDQQTFSVINGVPINRKIVCVYADTYIYIALSSSIAIYDWAGIRVSSIDIGNQLMTSCMIEMGPKIVVTDCFGMVVEFIVESLKQTKLNKS